MNGTQMIYREVVPSTDLESFVMSFWEFVVSDDTSEPIEHEIFPDGCISVFYLRNFNRGLNHVGISGPQLETFTKTVSGGDTYWGMRVSPAACFPFLNPEADKINLSGVVETPLHPYFTHGLSEKLAAAKSFDGAVLIYENRLREFIVTCGTCDPEIAKAVRLIDAARGEIRVDDLALSVSLSTRQFQRRFKASSGLSPKQYIRARRIRATAVSLVEKQDQNWAHRAAELGFADQAHLTHEFTSLTNRSPISFAEKVGKIRHGNLVK